ncbi:glycoside hydrolase family 5 protein [Pedobacter boryungensis]|uniref:Cellulase family glycosylhydrolase n=1 Tax=Pedobacter boryungensis TaxID=869962 RepID=A0ABX2DEP4_9SPHI|nr:cellulase family glycosylhydrolase [Pedobacter boryungensis]NQX32568.1 cellulase family glycosylhydrolase [Pedobacter boryungensis]
MKYLKFLIALLFPIVLQAQSQKFFNVVGKDIVAPNGKPIVLKGTNLGNWLIPEGYMFKFKDVSSPRMINQVFTELIGPDKTAAFWQKYLTNYITKEDIHYLKSSGMNSIRIPFHYKLFTTESYLGTNNANRGFELLDRVIKWCKEEDLPVILDMHCAPGGQTGDNIDDSDGYPFLFENEASQKLTISIWKKIAAHYKNEPTIIGYDLLNEPIAHYFDTKKLNPYLEPLYKAITAAVRTVDKNHLIFLGGAQWDSNFKIFNRPFDSKLVYTFHKYWTATTQDVIQEYLDFSNKYNVPIYVGETGENNDKWIFEFRTLMEKHNISWHFWPYKKMDAKAGIVSFPVPEHYNLIIKYADQPKNSFADLRKYAPTDRVLMETALNNLLEQCKFQNCYTNNGYLKGLGLKEGK